MATTRRPHAIDPGSAYWGRPAAGLSPTISAGALAAQLRTHRAAPPAGDALAAIRAACAHGPWEVTAHGSHCLACGHLAPWSWLVVACGVGR